MIDIDLKNVKGIILDIDNTLYPYAPCNQYAQQICFEYLQEQFPDTTIETFKQLYSKGRKNTHHTLHTQGASHSRFLYFQQLLESLLGSSHYQMTLHLEQLYWNAFLEKMELDTQAKLFLQRCREQKLPICLLTDLTANIQFRKVLKLGLQDYCSFIVTSEEAGVEKPHPYMFMLALKKLNLATHEVVMIGDNKDKDIKGAELLGIKTFYYTPS